VSSDLEARGRATAARHAGRAEVAAAFLHATSVLPSRDAAGPEEAMHTEIVSALDAFPDKVHVKCTGDENWRKVTAICHKDEGFQVRIDNGEWKRMTQIVQYTTNTK
jgi:hypothetical protein